MSDLGFFENLLDGTEVEWKPLGEVARKIYSGATPDTTVSEYWENGTVPWMSSGEVNLKTVYRTEKFITEKGLKNSSARLVPANSVVIALAGQGKTRGKVARTRIELTTNQSLAAIVCDPCNLDANYVFHYLESRYENLRKISSGNSGRGGLNLKLISDYCIPIPSPGQPEKSLAIQGEIVRILDSFTELTVELTAELAAELELRKKQYRHYRNRLLTDDNRDFDWLPMADIGQFIRGKRFTKADYRDEGIRAIHYGEIYTHYGVFAYETLSKVRADMTNSLRFAEKNDVIMAGVSETLEDVGKAVAWLGEDKVAIHDDSYAFRHAMNPKYIAYAMQTDAFHDQKGQFVSRGKIKRLLIDGMKKVKLPIPFADDPKESLAEQARIVAILDKFDALTTSLSEGLPREIDLRQKQYEYYRDLLLTFPKPAEAAEA